MIKVLIIDDSAVTRAVLQKILNSDAAIEVVGTAIDPIIAAKKIQSVKPDVITLDLEMPRMDGLTFLKKLRAGNPHPVVVISGNSPKSSQNAIKALEYGALEIIEKPDISTPEKLAEVSESICHAVKSAYESISEKPAVFTPILEQSGKKVNKVTSHFYVIGSSTGGPDVLKDIFSQLKSSGPGYVIAQHMPALFTKSFAERLNTLSALDIREANDGDYIRSGQALIIPGGFHGVVKKDETGYYLRLNQEEKVNRHRPSVDVLFNSAAEVAGAKATGILLTGMGDDGARGLLNLKEHGSLTISQDAVSSVVYGMPKRAFELGASVEVMNPNQIIEFLNTNA